MTFYEKIKGLRLSKKVSQQEIAEYLGVTKQAYSLYELGKRNVDNETLLKLSEYFGVSVDYLLGKEEKKVVTDDDIKFALWGGEAENVDEEMLDDVYEYAKMRMKLKKQKMSDDNGK